MHWKVPAGTELPGGWGGGGGGLGWRGGGGQWEGPGGGGGLYLTLHCHNQNDFCIKMSNEESHVNVSLTGRGKVTRQVSPNHSCTTVQ